MSTAQTDTDWASQQHLQSILSQLSQVQLEKADGELITMPELAGKVGEPGWYDRGTEYARWHDEQKSVKQIGPSVRIAGRVDLNRQAGRVLLIKLEHVGDEPVILCTPFDSESHKFCDVKNQYFAVVKKLRRGDYIDVTGRLGRTHRGTPAIFVDLLHS